MQKKKSWTLQKWTLLTKRPVPLTCHHVGPKKTMITPLITIHMNDAIAPTPKRYTQELTNAGCLSGRT